VAAAAVMAMTTMTIFTAIYGLISSLQCFDAVGWAAGRASRPVKN